MAALSSYPISDTWGYIDKTGKTVIESRFDYAFVFSEGLAYVRIDKKWGYIDKTGKMVVEPQFDRAFGFSEGLANVGFKGDSR